MDRDPEIINKVSSSGLLTIDLEALVPKVTFGEFDLAPFLYQELILKEKDFREKLSTFKWELFQNQWVAIHCSTDAIIPTWAYMLVSVYLEPVAKRIVFGKTEALLAILFQDTIASLNAETYKDQKVVIKGCSKEVVPLSAYVELIAMLRPVAKSIMYGEPCSTVPLYKKTRATSSSKVNL